jgi:hypothetical protein
MRDSAQFGGYHLSETDLDDSRAPFDEASSLSTFLHAQAVLNRTVTLGLRGADHRPPMTENPGLGINQSDGRRHDCLCGHAERLKVTN